jgi:hypothetical protein
LVTSCGPSDKQVSSNSLNFAFASCIGHAFMGITFQTSLLTSLVDNSSIRRHTYTAYAVIDNAP